MFSLFSIVVVVVVVMFTNLLLHINSIDHDSEHNFSFSFKFCYKDERIMKYFNSNIQSYLYIHFTMKNEFSLFSFPVSSLFFISKNVKKNIKML
jgi:hypothetical protein